MSYTKVYADICHEVKEGCAAQSSIAVQNQLWRTAAAQPVGLVPRVRSSMFVAQGLRVLVADQIQDDLAFLLR